MRDASIVGLISDTHGLLRNEALAALQKSDLIIHAGDVGDAEILDRLRAIAPVVAVRGNIDTAPWASGLEMTAVVEAGPAVIYVLHDVYDLHLDPAVAGFDIVVSGHSHKTEPKSPIRRSLYQPWKRWPATFQATRDCCTSQLVPGAVGRRVHRPTNCKVDIDEA